MIMMTCLKGLFRRKRYSFLKKKRWELREEEIPGFFVIRFVYSVDYNEEDGMLF